MKRTKEYIKRTICLLSLYIPLYIWAQPSYLSREMYRNKVEAYSQQLKQQHLQRQISTLERKKTRTNFFPHIRMEVDGTLNLSDLRAWNEPLGEYRNHTYQGQLVMEQPLYTGGSLRAKQKIAKVDEQLDLLQEEQTLDQIHYQSDALYWNASASRALLQAAAQYHEIVNQLYLLTQDRFNDGMIDRTDLLMIATRLKEAKLQYVKARQEETLARQKLNIFMGEDPNTPVDSLCSIEQSTPLPVILSLENVLNRRTEYQSTQLNLVKSKAQRKASLSQYNPKLSMYFRGGWATANPNLGYDVSFNPIIGIQLNIPLFQWGARFQTNRQQKSQILIQELQKSDVTDHIKEELSNALTQLKETACQVTTAHETMKLANESLDLLSFSYKEGKANMVDVLSAQMAWTQARSHLIHAYLAQKMAIAQYSRVISE